jgi:hypothetical protein
MALENKSIHHFHPPKSWIHSSVGDRENSQTQRTQMTQSEEEEEEEEEGTCKQIILLFFLPLAFQRHLKETHSRTEEGERGKKKTQKSTKR